MRQSTNGGSTGQRPAAAPGPWLVGSGFRRALIVSVQFALLQPLGVWHGWARAQACDAATGGANAPGPVDGGEGTVQDMPGGASVSQADLLATVDTNAPVEVLDKQPALDLGYTDASRDPDQYSGTSATGEPSGRDSHGGDSADSGFTSFGGLSAFMSNSIGYKSASWLFSYGPSYGGGKGYIDDWMLAVLDPIDLSQANKPHIQVDYESGGAAPLKMVRIYHSNQAAYNARLTIPMGSGWRSGYDASIETLSQSQVRLHRANGRRLDFTWNGAQWSSGTRAGVLTFIGNGWSYRTQRDATETYDSSGRLVAQTLDGHVTTLHYDGAGRLWRVINPFGRTLTFAYDGLGRVASVTLPSGYSLGYLYGSSNNLVGIRFADNSVRQYLYENTAVPNGLTGVIDESGRRRLTWTYDTSGRPTGGWYGNNVARVSIVYDGNRVITTDARNTQRTRYLAALPGRTAVSNIATAATADSSATAWTVGFDAAGEVNRVTSRSGEVVERDNDARGLPYRLTRGAGTAQALTTNLAWHATWNKPVQISSAGVTHTQEIDAAGRVTAITRTAPGAPTTTVLSRVFNGQNLLVSSTDARGATTSYGYDNVGNVASVTDSLGRTTLYQNHNAHGQAQRIVRANGGEVARSFDVRGRLVARTDSGLTTQFEYDPAGRFSRITFPDGGWQTYGYTEAGHLVSINNHRSETTVFTRDAAGEVIAQDTYNASGTRIKTANRRFDAVGRLATQTDSRNNTTRMLYDPATARASGVTDPSGRTIALTLDTLGRTTAVTQPNTAAMAPVTGPTRTTTHTYSQDGRGLHLRTVDTNTVATDYGYDALNRGAQEASSDAGTRSVSRNAAGDVAVATDARAVSVTRSVDSIGRVTAITPAAGAPLTFAYVPGRSDGLLAQMSYGAGSTSWTHDSAGRLLTRRQTAAGITRQLSITRDGLGRPTTLIYPSGLQVGIGYNGDAVSALTVNGTVLLDNITYRPFSQTPTGWRWGNGSAHARSFDLDGRTTSVTLGPSTRSYSHDAVGRVSALVDTGPGIHRASSFSYDAADQLAGYSGPQGSHSYGWDTNGNRRSEVVGGVSRQYHYESNSNRLSYLPAVRGMRYNADGNPLADDGTGFTFTYDALQRLVQSYRAQSIDVAAAYDALGMRVYKAVSSYTACGPGGDIPMGGNPVSTARAGKPAKTQATGGKPSLRTLDNPSCWESAGGSVFFHSDQGQLLGEYDLIGNRVQETIWFAGMPVATVQRNGAMYYVHSDHLGTPRSITRPADNAEMWRWDSEPFGSTPAWVSPAVAYWPTLFSFNLRFAGQYFDVETGFHYNWMRHYDPRTGRYLEADPLGLGGGLARYTYGGGSPLRYADPTGLWSYAKEYGTNTSGLRPSILSIEIVVDQTFQLIAGRDAVVTYATNGQHKVDSFHYSGNAVDLRTRDLPKADLVLVTNLLKEAIGKRFDVINEGSHIHIEFDPKCPR